VFWTGISTGDGYTVGGTVSGSTTTLTGSTSVFHASMTGKTAVISGVGSFEITAVPASNQITVSGTATCSGATFAISNDGYYQLPSDFGGLMHKIVYGYDSSNDLGELMEKDLAYVEERRRKDNTRSDPQYYAIAVRGVNQNVQGYDIHVWPEPDDDYTAYYYYRQKVAPLTNSSGCYPVGTPEFSRVVLEAGLARAELITAHARGLHAENYSRMLANAVRRDGSAFSSDDAEHNMYQVE